MTQTYTTRIGQTEGTGPRKIKAANKAHWGKLKANKIKAQKARNAYRQAIGLPPAS